VTASNPAEVAKTRLQLQGELVKSGGARVYKNTLDVLVKTWRNEGIRGVQKGLVPAVRIIFIVVLTLSYGLYLWLVWLPGARHVPTHEHSDF
jgi:hypothetical protein